MDIERTAGCAAQRQAEKQKKGHGNQQKLHEGTRRHAHPRCGPHTHTVTRTYIASTQIPALQLADTTKKTAMG